jgi:hypothetical protein
MANLAILNAVDESLVRLHRMHRGMATRVAKTSGVDVSQVTRVVAGTRNNQKVLDAILTELRKIQTTK